MKNRFDCCSTGIASAIGFTSLSFVLVAAALSSTASAADYVQNSTCGLTNPAFIETFSTASPGGNGGDLDETKWAVSRYTGENSNTALMMYQQADIPACKQGAPSAAYPPGDILVCDNTMPGFAGRLMTAIAGQNYGITAFRARQPFDFAGRTGTIAFDVDAWTPGGLAHWAGFELTEDPIPCPNIASPSIEKNGNPRNGIVMRFMCDGSIAVMPNIFVYHNYVETQYSTTQCNTSKEQSLNHIEIRVSQNHMEVWASDYSTDGITFPNFRMIASVDNANLPFTRGYVTFSVNNHATQKYGYGRTGVHYWDNIGFDGPVLPADRIYEVSESLTPYDGTHLNTGFGLYDSSNTGGGAYTCCGTGTGKAAPFSFSDVDMTGAASAVLVYNAFYVFYNMQGPIDPAKINVQYRLNGGAWKDRFLTPDEITALTWTIGSFGTPSIPHVTSLALADVHQGSNTVEFRTINASSFPVVIGNVALNVRGTSGTTSLTRGAAASRHGNNLVCTSSPLGSTTTLRIQVSSVRQINLDVCTVSGQLVQHLAAGRMIGAGVTNFVWNGNDASGHAQMPGVYLVRAKIGDERFDSRILKIR